MTSAESIWEVRDYRLMRESVFHSDVDSYRLWVIVFQAKKIILNIRGILLLPAQEMQLGKPSAISNAELLNHIERVGILFYKHQSKNEDGINGIQSGKTL
jgi:hypothetical protein